jgi:hypothetical protein
MLDYILVPSLLYLVASVAMHPSAPAPPGRRSCVPRPRPLGCRFLRNDDIDRYPPLRPGGYRTRHPPSTRPGRHRPPELGVGHPCRPESGHGPRRRRTPGQVPDPGSGRKYPALFDAILADAGITVVLSGVGIPRMNSIMEHWIQSCRHELLDRTLIWNQTHLLHALRKYERHDNDHRPRRGIANARPLQPLPKPITDPATITHLHVRRHDRLAGLLHEYDHAA